MRDESILAEAHLDWNRAVCAQRRGEKGDRRAQPPRREAGCVLEQGLHKRGLSVTEDGAAMPSLQTRESLNPVTLRRLHYGLLRAP